MFNPLDLDPSSKADLKFYDKYNTGFMTFTVKSEPYVYKEHCSLKVCQIDTVNQGNWSLSIE